MLFQLLFSPLRSNQYLLGHREKRSIFGIISPQLNKYCLHRKVENGRWKSMQHCICYVYIILWNNQNSNTELEPECWVCENQAPRYVEPGQKTGGVCPVRVTQPPRDSGSGIWPGLEPNRTKQPVKTWIAGMLPRPVAHTYLVQHLIGKIEQNILHNGQRWLEIGQSGLQ